MRTDMDERYLILGVGTVAMWLTITLAVWASERLRGWRDRRWCRQEEVRRQAKLDRALKNSASSR